VKLRQEEARLRPATGRCARCGHHLQASLTCDLLPLPPLLLPPLLLPPLLLPPLLLLLLLAAAASDIVRQLLNHGCDPQAADADGNFPLMAAAESGFTEVISDLAAADIYRLVVVGDPLGRLSSLDIGLAGLLCHVVFIPMCLICGQWPLLDIFVDRWLAGCDLSSRRSGGSSCRQGL